MKVLLFLCCLVAINGQMSHRKCRKHLDTKCTKIINCNKAIEANRNNVPHYLKNCGWDNESLEPTEYLCCPTDSIINTASTTTPEPVDFEEVGLRSTGIAQVQCDRFKKETYPNKINDDRILEGEVAFPGQFPHMVALGTENSNGDFEWGFCGGTLISERFVLTAAHCQVRDRNFVRSVLLGRNDLSGNSNETEGVEIPVKRILIYNEQRVQEHDIALIELERNVSFSQYIRPACLYLNDEVPINTPISVSGWGATNRDNTAIRSNQLMKANLNLRNNDDCTSLLKKKPINKYYVCAMDTEKNGKRDTCLGDSGGPLHTLTQQLPLTYHIIGITSSGFGCGGNDNPGFYTRVSKYIGWIERNVWA